MSVIRMPMTQSAGHTLEYVVSQLSLYFQLLSCSLLHALSVGLANQIERIEVLRSTVEVQPPKSRPGGVFTEFGDP